MFVEHELYDIGEGTPRVSISANKPPCQRNWATVAFHLSKTIATHIGVQPGARVTFGIGKFADIGWIRIRRGDNHRAEKHGHEGSVRVRMSGRKLGVDENYPAETVKFHLGIDSSGGYVAVLLPGWARRDTKDKD